MHIFCNSVIVPVRKHCRAAEPFPCMASRPGGNVRGQKHKFWTCHDLLFGDPAHRTDADFKNRVTQLGVNSAQFNARSSLLNFPPPLTQSDQFCGPAPIFWRKT